MIDSHDAKIGVIEGFYGRSWRWEDRWDYAGFFKEHGYRYYIYAPKGDPFLRRRWQEPWPAATAEKIAALAHHYRKMGVLFGIGLSPYEIYLNYGTEAKRQLAQKVEELNAMPYDCLCVLFDDMKGDISNLARLQVDIVHQLAASSVASTLILCPTYYSYDPILTKVFGPMPEHYLDDLGRWLDPAIHLFWTGPHVISHEYPPSHLREVTERLQRQPFLWDNRLANDGARQSQFLHLRSPRRGA